MNGTKPTWTSTQKLVASGVFSLFASAVITSLSAVDQYYTSHATVNISVLLLTFLTVFGASFGTALYAYVPSHITQEMQAIKDTVAELQAQIHGSSSGSAATKALVHITASTVSVPQTVQPPSVASLDTVPSISIVHTPEDAETPTVKVPSIKLGVVPNAG